MSNLLESRETTMGSSPATEIYLPFDRIGAIGSNKSIQTEFFNWMLENVGPIRSKWDVYGSWNVNGTNYMIIRIIDADAAMMTKLRWSGQ